TRSSGAGGSGTARAARSSSLTAGNEPAACTDELRLYAPFPSIGAGLKNLDWSDILTLCAAMLATFRAWVEGATGKAFLNSQQSSLNTQLVSNASSFARGLWQAATSSSP